MHTIYRLVLLVTVALLLAAGGVFAQNGQPTREQRWREIQGECQAPRGGVAHVGIVGATVSRLAATLLAVTLEGASFCTAGAAAADGSRADRHGHTSRSPDSGWSRVYVRDVYARAAIRGALTDAASWLAYPSCRGLLSEFRDARGRPLTERLAEVGGQVEHYLGWLLFFDASESPACSRGDVLAFTAPGSRVVYVCGRDFARASRRDAELGPSVIIHELLHSLGLPERPPTPGRITFRVQQACWPREDARERPAGSTAVRAGPDDVTGPHRPFSQGASR
jgi:hypothetical protein